ncbi:transposase [Fibrisoma limi]|uniref:transposase n=1 Tax=Fibrisoma limi TaxID=663275 RepID=UPI000A0662C8
MCLTKPLKRWPRAGGPVELSYVKGSIQDAARELGVDPGRIRKWRQRSKKADQIQPASSTLTPEQQQIRQLQRELKEAQLERDILKKAVSRAASSPGATARLTVGNIPIYSRTCQSVSHGPPCG